MTGKLVTVNGDSIDGAAAVEVCLQLFRSRSVIHLNIALNNNSVLHNNIIVIIELSMY